MQNSSAKLLFFTSIRTAVEMGFHSLPLSKKLFSFQNGTVYYAILFSTTHTIIFFKYFPVSDRLKSLS